MIAGIKSQVDQNDPAKLTTCYFSFGKSIEKLFVQNVLLFPVFLKTKRKSGNGNNAGDRYKKKTGPTHQSRKTLVKI